MNNLSVIESAKVSNLTTFKNEKLNAITAEISGYIQNTVNNANANHVRIARALAKVNSEALYKDDGFSTAIDYAMTTFGWKKANAYAMMQVGAKLNAGELPEGNYSVSQYREMLPLSLTQAQNAISNGDIDPQMSAKDIREAVSAIKPKRKVERKAKPEKRHEWYLDGVPGRKDIIATASELESAECEAIQPVKMEVAGEKVFGYLICKGGIFRFYKQGIEAPVAEAEATEAEAEATEAEATEENNG